MVRRGQFKNGKSLQSRKSRIATSQLMWKYLFNNHDVMFQLFWINMPFPQI